MEIEMILNDDTVTVHYDLEKEEKATHDHPGCKMEVDIYDIFYNDISVHKIVNSNDIEELEGKIYDIIKNE